MWKYLSLFFLFQTTLYIWMISMRHTVLFNVEHFNNFYNKHFKQESRDKAPEDFLKNLVVYDAQWYLFLANQFYESPTSEDFQNPTYSKRVLQFAFFPLYPLTLSMFHRISPFQNIETSAFIVSIILQIATSITMFLFIKRVTNEKIATYTLLLLFFAPFSIFFRSYYTEILFLFILILFCFFVFNKYYIIGALFLGFLTVTRGTAILLLLLFIAYLLLEYKKKRIRLIHLVISIIIAILPISSWMFVCYQKTGNPIFFISVKQYWLHTTFPLLRIIHAFSIYPFLPFHTFHASKVDIFMIVLVGFLLYKSRMSIPRFLWWIGFCLWITPLLSHDTMSFSRYQSVNFPVFLYLASVMKQSIFIVSFIASFALLAIISLLFLNYHWIG